MVDLSGSRAVAPAVIVAVLAGIGGIAAWSLRDTSGSTTTTIVTTSTTTTTQPTTTTTSTTTTTTAVPLGPPLPLTGIGSPPGFVPRPAAVVKIDDYPTVNQHWGLEQADLISEVLVEGGLTRYLAVFHTNAPDRVGPVRSVRAGDGNLAKIFGHPLLVFSGGNDGAIGDAMSTPWLTTVLPTGSGAGAAFFRDRGLSAPHNQFVDLALVYRNVDGGENPPALFAFGDPPPGGESTGRLRIGYSGSSDAEFTWDDGRGQWLRSQRGHDQLDGAGVRVGVENVLVVAVDYATSPFDPRSPALVSTGSGEVTLMRDGQRFTGTWSRPTLDDPFVVTDSTGQPLRLHPGRTWIAFAPRGS